MELGLHVPNFTWANGPAALGADLATLARTADQAGFGYLSVMDHFFQIPSVGPAEHEMLEAYTTLGFLAAHTERVKLLTLVTGVIYRHPGVLAKAITTLDVLSGGRAVFGVGAGWNEEESRALGFEFPSTKERFELLEENLRYVRQMWDEGDAPFTGKHFEAQRLLNVPQPLTRPRPPILIGGGGEKKTLRFVAQYGDACNLGDSPELEHKLTVLKQHCEDVGRDYAEITKTVARVLDLTAKPADLLGHLERLHGLGIDAVFGVLTGEPDLAALERLGSDVIPAAGKF
ncbi:LLM class F420-dependent oxidoreductase [Amycolatopsis samaneae]|uniref:LLM class F420-dependent oxidoreductase n=1 Tax=Amycolatopsis samaneae TaxID=664691 RepID=A0ABW5GGM7_9PSEU